MNASASPFERVAGLLASLVMAVAATLMAAMTVIIGWQIFGRFVLNDTPSWSEELTGVLIVYMTLLGAAAGVWNGTHIAVDFLVEKLPAPARSATRILVLGLIALFGVIMVAYGAQMMSIVQNWTNATLQVTRSINYIAFPVAGALMALFAVGRIFYPPPHHTLSEQARPEPAGRFAGEERPE